MNPRSKIFTCLLAAAALGLGAGCGRTDSNSDTRGATTGSDTPTAATSTTPTTTPTAIDASVTSVQQALTTDASLSQWSTNVSAMAQGNRIVLRGTVPTAEAKTRIEQRAREVASGTEIDSQITVSADNMKTGGAPNN